jgi:hypothetical protein
VNKNAPLPKKETNNEIEIISKKNFKKRSLIACPMKIHFLVHILLRQRLELFQILDSVGHPHRETCEQ